MGQAKNRGTYEQRVAQAKARKAQMLFDQQQQYQRLQGIARAKNNPQPAVSVAVTAKATLS